MTCLKTTYYYICIFKSNKHNKKAICITRVTNFFSVPIKHNILFLNSFITTIVLTYSVETLNIFKLENYRYSFDKNSSRLMELFLND